MKDLPSMVRIQLGHLACRFPYRQPATDDPAGRCPGDHVEEITRRSPGALFNPFKNAGRYDPSDAAAIDAQNTDDLIWHGALPPYNHLGRPSRQPVSRPVYRPISNAWL